MIGQKKQKQKNEPHVQIPTSLNPRDSTSDRHCSMIVGTVPHGTCSLPVSLRSRNSSSTPKTDKKKIVRQNFKKSREIYV